MTHDFNARCTVHHNVTACDRPVWHDGPCRQDPNDLATQLPRSEAMEAIYTDTPTATAMLRLLSEALEALSMSPDDLPQHERQEVIDGTCADIRQMLAKTTGGVA